ncbi:MAG: hypothetical protein ACE141_03485 [Bryobacteraceae bacterium]
MAVLTFLLSILWGWLLVRLVGPTRGMRPRWAAVLAEAALGAGAGAGLASLLYFLLLVTDAASQGAVLLAHALTIALLVILSFRFRTAVVEAESPVRPGFRWNWAILLVLAACLVPVLIVMIEGNLANPHGQWDGFAIWNLRARYLAGPGEAWRNAISPLLTRTHADYPLLLSGFIAQSWKAAGGEASTVIPIATGFLYAGSVIGLVIASLALLRGTSLGLLAGLVLVSDRTFLRDLSMQYSDVPLACYYLGTLLLVFLSEREDKLRGPVLALSGCFMSLAAWTKDEGIVFAVIFTGCLAAYEWWDGKWGTVFRHLPWFFGGALPGLLVVAGFKLFLVPKVNPMIDQSPAEATVRLLTWKRWWNLLQGMGHSAASMGDGIIHPFLVLAILAVALGISLSTSHRRRFVMGAATLCMVLAGYCGALLVNRTLLGSPRSHPLPRMYTQLWPSLVVVALLPLRALEETVRAEPEPVAKRKKNRRAS